eukprot:1539556-Prymnesium_polylepis.1
MDWPWRAHEAANRQRRAASAASECDGQGRIKGGRRCADWANGEECSIPERWPAPSVRRLVRCGRPSLFCAGQLLTQVGRNAINHSST